LGLLLLVVVLLLSPVEVAWVGLPPRIEAYKSISTDAATAGAVIDAIYHSPRQADVVFLGSSLVTAAIDRDIVQSALSGHLHRSANVQMLAMNWPGVDVQYFMLRDYLNQHQPRLIVWNLPEPHARAYDAPHVQAYRWLRFGEYADALRGLSLDRQLALYGEMVIGAPRQLLSTLRPNRYDGEGVALETSLARRGFMGAAFVLDNALPGSENRAQLLQLDVPTLAVHGPVPGPYQMHFIRLIDELAATHHCRIVLLHIPTFAEFNDTAVPELAEWKNLQFVATSKTIAVPAATLFQGMDRSRFNHFYRDTHLNENGSRYFTQAILWALLQAYDEAEASRS
jgi:hypothetical protein